VPKSKYGLLTDTRGRYADTTVSPHVSKAARRITMYCAQAAYSLLTALRAWVMMVCCRRAKACATIVHAEVTVRRVSTAPTRVRGFKPNSDSTSSTVRNTDSRHCAGKAAQDHILAVDTHINFPIERTTERSWRGRSPYLSYNRLLLAEPTCRGPTQCKHSPWSIKGRVHPLEHKFFLRLSQGLDPQAVHKHTQAI
jgi:hypothetical protein